MMSRPKVFVAGSMAMDLVVRADRMPQKGETLIGSHFFRALGGKGANQAVAAARLGGRVTMVGRVGDDLFGQEQRAGLRAENIDDEFVVVDEEAETGVALITITNGDNRIIVVPGANMACTVDDVTRATSALQQADVVLLQLEIDMAVNRYIVQEADALRKTIVFNPAPAQSIDEETLKKITVLTPNETEAETLTGMSVTTVSEAKKAALDLRGRGVDHVIITLGDQGCFIATEDVTSHVPPWPADVVDPTAAGDTFNGAVAVKLAERRRGSPIDLPLLRETAMFANAAGALAVTKTGAQPSIPKLEAVQQFMREHRPIKS